MWNAHNTVLGEEARLIYIIPEGGGQTAPKVAPNKQGLGQNYAVEGSNCTDFATFNFLLNALIADPLRPNFGLSPAYLRQLWGLLPQNG